MGKLHLPVSGLVSALVLLLLLSLWVPSSRAAVLFAAPPGSCNETAVTKEDFTLDNPGCYPFVLGTLRPGDSLFLRGGIYTGVGVVSQSLSDSASPATISSYNSEEVTLVDAMDINSSNLIIENLKFDVLSNRCLFIYSASAEPIDSILVRNCVFKTCGMIDKGPAIEVGKSVENVRVEEVLVESAVDLGILVPGHTVDWTFLIVSRSVFYSKDGISVGMKTKGIVLENSLFFCDLRALHLYGTTEVIINDILVASRGDEPVLDTIHLDFGENSRGSISTSLFVLPVDRDELVLMSFSAFSRLPENLITFTDNVFSIAGDGPLAYDSTATTLSDYMQFTELILAWNSGNQENSPQLLPFYLPTTELVTSQLSAYGDHDGLDTEAASLGDFYKLDPSLSAVQTKGPFHTVPGTNNTFLKLHSPVWFDRIVGFSCELSHGRLSLSYLDSQVGLLACGKELASVDLRTGTQVQLFQAPGSQLFESVASLGDIDFDGLEDFVYHDSSAKLGYWYSHSGLFEGPAITEIADIICGDVDYDGRPDTFFVSNALLDIGGVYYLPRSLVPGTPAEPVLLWNDPLFPHHARSINFAGDLNEDDVLDLVVTFESPQEFPLAIFLHSSAEENLVSFQAQNMLPLFFDDTTNFPLGRGSQMIHIPSPSGASGELISFALLNSVTAESYTFFEVLSFPKSFPLLPMCPGAVCDNLEEFSVQWRGNATIRKVCIGRVRLSDCDDYLFYPDTDPKIADIHFRNVDLAGKLNMLIVLAGEVNPNQILTFTLFETPADPPIDYRYISYLEPGDPFIVNGTTTIVTDVAVQDSIVLVEGGGTTIQGDFSTVNATIEISQNSFINTSGTITISQSSVTINTDGSGDIFTSSGCINITNSTIEVVLGPGQSDGETRVNVLVQSVSCDPSLLPTIDASAPSYDQDCSSSYLDSSAPGTLAVVFLVQSSCGAAGTSEDESIATFFGHDWRIGELIGFIVAVIVIVFIVLFLVVFFVPPLKKRVFIWREKSLNMYGTEMQP